MTAANGHKDPLRLVSHFPGRLRVRAETFRVLPEVGAEVAQRLMEEEGILSAKSSSTTGSLLITYDPRALQLPRLTQLLVRFGGLYGLEVDAANDRLAGPEDGARVRDALASFNQALRGATRGHVDLKVAVPGSLAAGGIALFLAGRRRVPEWYDLLFWAFVTFSNMNPARPANERDAGGGTGSDGDGDPAG